MPRSQRLVQVLPLRQRKYARCASDSVALDNYAAVVNGIVREKYRLQHFRRRFAIYNDPRFDRFLKLYGLLNRDQRANPHFSKTLNRLYDDFNIFPLFMCRCKQRKISKFGQHSPQLRLKDYKNSQNEIRSESAEKVLQHFQFEKKTDQNKCEQKNQEARHHWRAASPAHKAKS